MKKSPQTLNTILKEHCKKWYAAQTALGKAEEETWKAALEFEGYDPKDWRELLLECWDFERYDSEDHCLKSISMQIRKAFLEMEKARLEDEINSLSSE